MVDSIVSVKEKKDSELVADSLANRDDFLHIVNRYTKALSSYVKRLTNLDDDELQDILQEIFIKIYLNLNDFNDSLNFSSWIYRIAHNHVISSYRKLKARPEGHAISLDEEGVKQLADGFDIIIKTDISLAREAINKILFNIDKKYRDILILKFLEEKNYQEISDIIKKPPGTVASTINRAKVAFRLEMKKQGIKF